MCKFRTGEGNGNSLQYSCLENPMDGGAWWATFHGIEESNTTYQLNKKQQKFLIGALLTSEDPELHPPSMLALPCPEQGFHEEVCSLAAPVENISYLTLFLSLISSPQGPHASTWSHKYPEFLTFEEGSLNTCSPFLAALWKNPFSAGNLSSSAFGLLCLGQTHWV